MHMHCRKFEKIQKSIKGEHKNGPYFQRMKKKKTWYMVYILLDHI